MKTNDELLTMATAWTERVQSGESSDTQALDELQAIRDEIALTGGSEAASVTAFLDLVAAIMRPMICPEST